MKNYKEQVKIGDKYEVKTIICKIPECYSYDRIEIKTQSDVEKFNEDYVDNDRIQIQKIK